MRVSTGMIFESGVNSIQQRTSSLLRTQQQISSGRRILSPSDDPVAAAQALEVTQSKGINAQYLTVQGHAKSNLGVMDAQLSSASDLLVRVRELTVQAGNASLTLADRKSIATELRARFDELVGLANSTDGTGQYLFSGYQGNNKPFAGSVDNGVGYLGDEGIRALRVSGSRNLPISESGNDVFMRIKNGNGTFVTGLAQEKSANAATATYEGATSPLPVPTTTGDFDIKFWVDSDGVAGPAGNTYYDLVDGKGNSLFAGAVSQTGAGGTYTHAYTSNTLIPLNNNPPPVLPPFVAPFDYGASLMFSGQPQTGDTFNVSRTATDLTVTPGVLTGNTARAVIDGGSITDPIQWSTSSNSGNLEVRFWVDVAGVVGGPGSEGETYYDLVDADTGNSLFSGVPSDPTTVAGRGGYATHAYTSGAPINFNGLAAAYNPPSNDFGASVKITGNPATGDTFTIKAGTDAKGNGYFVTAPKMQPMENMGSSIIGAGEVLDQAKWLNPANSRQLEVRFWKDPNDLSANPPVYYDLVDTETERSLFTDTASTSGGVGNTYTHAFKSGDAINFSGLADPYTDFGVSVTIQGTPASGDVFSVQDSTTQSVFSSLADLIHAIESPVGPVGSNSNANLQNKLGFALTNFSKVEDNLLRVRADIGTRMSEVDNLGQVAEDLNLQYEDSLSRLQDLDYAKAITDLTRTQTELQAAQQSFAKISGMSLFNYL